MPGPRIFSWKMPPRSTLTPLSMNATYHSMFRMCRMYICITYDLCVFFQRSFPPVDIHRPSYMLVGIHPARVGVVSVPNYHLNCRETSPMVASYGIEKVVASKTKSGTNAKLTRGIRNEWKTPPKQNKNGCIYKTKKTGKNHRRPPQTGVQTASCWVVQHRVWLQSPYRAVISSLPPRTTGP